MADTQSQSHANDITTQLGKAALDNTRTLCATLGTFLEACSLATSIRLFLEAHPLFTISEPVSDIP
jgi:hypothetical protein